MSATKTVAPACLCRPRAYEDVSICGNENDSGSLFCFCVEAEKKKKRKQKKKEKRQAEKKPMNKKYG